MRLISRAVIGQKLRHTAESGADLGDLTRAGALDDLLDRVGELGHRMDRKIGHAATPSDWTWVLAALFGQAAIGRNTTATIIGVSSMRAGGSTIRKPPSSLQR